MSVKGIIGAGIVSAATVLSGCAVHNMPRRASLGSEVANKTYSISTKEAARIISKAQGRTSYPKFMEDTLNVQEEGIILKEDNSGLFRGMSFMSIFKKPVVTKDSTIQDVNFYKNGKIFSRYEGVTRTNGSKTESYTRLNSNKKTKMGYTKALGTNGEDAYFKTDKNGSKTILTAKEYKDGLIKDGYVIK